MRLPDSVILGTTVSMALSHCSEANVTEGILLCTSEADLVKIADTILEARSLAAHPAALATIVCKFLADMLNYKIEATWRETYLLETASGQTGIVLVSSTDVNVRVPEAALQMIRRRSSSAHMHDIEADRFRRSRNGQSTEPACPGSENPQNWEQQLALRQRSVGLAQLALAWQMYSQTLHRLTELVHRFLESEGLSKDLVESDAETAVGKEQHMALQQEMDYLSQRAVEVVARAEYLRGRLDLQNTAVSVVSSLNPRSTILRYLLTLIRFWHNNNYYIGQQLPRSSYG
jgi:hypothetical protein